MTMLFPRYKPLGVWRISCDGGADLNQTVVPIRPSSITNKITVLWPVVKSAIQKEERKKARKKERKKGKETAKAWISECGSETLHIPTQKVQGMGYSLYQGQGWGSNTGN